MKLFDQFAFETHRCPDENPSVHQRIFHFKLFISKHSWLNFIGSDMPRVWQIIYVFKTKFFGVPGLRGWEGMPTHFFSANFFAAFLHSNQSWLHVAEVRKKQILKIAPFRGTVLENSIISTNKSWKIYHFDENILRIPPFRWTNIENSTIATKQSWKIHHFEWKFLSIPPFR